MLNFDVFNTEGCCDIVTILDGIDIKAPIIAHVAGSPPQSMGPYASTQKYMFVRFTTDNTVVDTGFNATYISTGR